MEKSDKHMGDAVQLKAFRPLCPYRSGSSSFNSAQRLGNRAPKAVDEVDYISKPIFSCGSSQDCLDDELTSVDSTDDSSSSSVSSSSLEQYRSTDHDEFTRSEDPASTASEPLLNKKYIKPINVHHNLATVATKSSSLDLRNRYQQMFEECDMNQIRTELFTLTRQNSHCHVKVLCDVLHGAGYHLTDQQLLGETLEETALAVAIIKDNTETAKVLIAHGGRDLILMPYNTEEFAGITAVHLAIMKNNIAVLEHIMDSVDEMVVSEILRSRAYGSYLSNAHTFAWYPLALAAGVGSIEIFDLLLAHGANPLVRDLSTGNTIFHCLARVALAAPELATKMMTHILKSTEIERWWHRHKNDNNECFEKRKSISRHLAEALLKLQNYDGQTPLTYAVCIGSTSFAQSLLEVRHLYSFPQWNVGPNQLTLHEVSEIDPALGDKPCVSVLESYAFVLSADNLVLGNVPAIKQSMLNKWKVYRCWFYLWFVFHTFIMTLLTTCIVHRFVPWCSTRLNDSINADYVYVGEIVVEEDETDLKDITLIVFEGVVVLTALFYFVLELYDIVMLLKRQYWHYRGLPRKTKFWLTLQFDVFRIILIIFSMSIFCLAAFRILESPWQDFAFAIGSLSGWIFLLFFTRAFKNIGIFVVMAQSMVRKELAYFSVVIVVIVCGCGVAIFCMFLASPHPTPDQVATLFDTFFSLFRLMVGLEELDIFYAARVPWIVKTFFVLFVLFVNILLLNMLIAAMNNTYNQLDDRKELMWLQMRTKAILLIERRLARCVKPYNRLEQLDPSRPDAWFLTSKEIRLGHPLANLTEQSFISNAL